MVVEKITGLTSHSICTMKRGCDLAAVFKSFGKHQMCILQKERRRKGNGKYVKSTVYVVLEGGDGIFVKRGAEELTLRMCQGANISALRYFCKDTTYCCKVCRLERIPLRAFSVRMTGWLDRPCPKPALARCRMCHISSVFIYGCPLNIKLMNNP